MKYRAEEIIQIHQNRYACKKYDSNKKISDQDFQTILEVARLSPNSFGFEPWKLLVIENEDFKKELYPIAWGAQKSLEGASKFVILLAKKGNDLVAGSTFLKDRMENVQHLPTEIQTMRMKKYADFQKNDFALLEQEDGLFQWASKQCYIQLANMMTCASMLEIDSCPIEGFHMKKVEELLKKYGVDTQSYGPAVMVSFGYRDQQPRPKTRQSIDQLVETL